MVTIILLQLFWVSFVSIGLAEILLLRRWVRPGRNVFVQFVYGAHPVLQAVMLFMLGLMPLVPIIVTGCILQWPLTVLTVVYLSVFAGAFVVIISNLKMIVRYMRRGLRVSRTTLLLSCVAGASLLFDFIVSLRVGAPIYGDAPVQLAKITFFKDVHLSLADPYYSNHGVVDPRYSTNVLDACQALAARLLHTTAINVWKNSYGVYRLIVWLSLFGVLWTYLGKKYRYLAYVVLATMPFVWGGYLIFANLPDRIVLAWAMLFLIGLKLWLETESWPLMVIASLLTATTHALFSLILLGYVMLVSICLWVSRTIPLRRMVVPLVCIGLLAFPIVLNLHYPNHTNQDAKAFISGTIAGTPPQPRNYGPLVLSSLPPVPVFTLTVYALFVIYIWLMKKTGHRKLTLFAYITGCLAVIITFSANIFALVGYGAIVYLVKQRSVRVAVVALIVYYGLIAYNPIFWHVELHKIPLWFVGRFQELNVFGVVATTLGLIFAASYPLERWGYRRSSYVMIAVVTCLSIVYFRQPTTNDYNIHAMWDTKNIVFQAQRDQSSAAIAALSPELRGQLVYSNDPNVAIRVPGIVVANVYSFNPENESPMTNIARRERCSARLAATMNIDDLRASGITRIITDPPYSLKMARMAKSRPYLLRIAEADDYQVYAVNVGKVNSASTSNCAVPFGQ